MTTVEPRPAPPASFADDDLEQLRLLSVFHYVVAGITALVSLLPGFQLLFGLLMASGHLAAEDEGSRVFGFLMAGCASFLLFTGMGLAAAIALAGHSIARRRRYTYTLVVAGVLCVFVPLGTILGVLTFVVLVRPSVRALFPA